MKVTVDYLGYLKGLMDLTQPENVALPEGASVRDLLLGLAEKHGAPFTKTLFEQGSPDLKGNIIMTVNGLLLNQLNGLDSKLNDGDRVVFMPIVSGG